MIKTSKGHYILLQSALMLVAPICSLVVSIRFFRNPISQLFFVIFAFYFGYYYPLDWDLNNHWIDLTRYYGRSLNEVLSLGVTFYYGNEPYHILLKYIISRFTKSPEFFGGITCAIYAGLFIFFIRQFKSFYQNDLGLLSIILLAAVALVIEFRWFQGVRYCPGTFFFMGFYLKYINTEKIKYLVLSCLCVLFHFSLLIFPLALILNWVFNKLGMTFRYIAVILSYVVRSWQIDFVPFILKYTPFGWWFKHSLIDDSIRQYDIRGTLAYYKYQNVFYGHRSDLAIIFGIFLLYLFHKKKMLLMNRYFGLFLMFLTMVVVANFGYTNYTLYTRFLKNSVLVLYSYLFICSVVNSNKIKGSNLVLSSIALIPMLYMAATVLVEQRHYLYEMPLLFGNFFRQGADILKFARLF